MCSEAIGAANVLTGGAGNDTYVVSAGDTVVEMPTKGLIQFKVMSHGHGCQYRERDPAWECGAIDGTGNALNNVITGDSAGNVLAGGLGNDTLKGGTGNDTYQVSKGDGQDVVPETSGTNTLAYGTGINPLDIVLSRQVNDLRLVVHGISDQVTIKDWYLGSANQTGVMQAGNRQQLLNTQVDQLIQARASFTQQSDLTWNQAIDQRPQDVQAALAVSWR